LTYKKNSGGVRPPSRFTRSVHLERDLFDPNALEGYVLTGAARRALRRLVSGGLGGTRQRAWTLTGPYGTGKSAFALFAADLFAHRHERRAAHSWKLLDRGDADLARDAQKKLEVSLWPVVVTGSQEPLGVALLRGLKRSLERRQTKATARMVPEVSRQLRRALNGTVPSAREVSDLFASTVLALCRGSQSTGGMLLVVDELGKLLEHSAAHPEDSDVYVFQALAESAAGQSHPFLILGILHQDFSAYTTALSSQDRAEWEKVRGRFEDIAFEESADDMLRLVAEARSMATTARTSEVPKSFKASCDEAWKLDLAPPRLGHAEFTYLALACWPLHPLVSVILGYLFRRLAQNERSVFSFLESAEPFGLRDFMDSRDSAASVYRIDCLYDYVTNALGQSLYLSARGKRWAEVETALSHVPNADPVQVFLIKSIGLLSALGDWRNARATRDILHSAASGLFSREEINRGLTALKQASAVVERRYNNTLSLWEGSDVDLDERVREAANHVAAAPTAQFLSREFAPPPIVARRHSYETGTLRYFPVSLAMTSGVARALETPLSHAAGRVLILIPETPKEETEAERGAKSAELASRVDTLVAVIRNVRGLRDAAQELQCLEWVRSHTPELEGDATARRELRARMAALRQRLERLIALALDPSDTAVRAARWFYQGQPLQIVSRRSFQEQLSSMCDQLYASTPRIRNELINRRELSSAAAKARRNLIEAMITHPTEPDLGIAGTPPEKSMYLSLLAASGIHRRSSDGWCFHSPRVDADPGMRAVWAAIETCFKQSERGAHPISVLFDVLRQPPFGLTDGPIPVLFCAALIANDADVALYEQGSFVPELTVAAFERLMKAPEQFAVQRWHVKGVRAEVFHQLAQMLGRDGLSANSTKARILQVVRPLCRFAAQLPAYTRNTQRLSEEPVAVRKCLLEARQPDALLFTELPRACGLPPFDESRTARAVDAGTFAIKLRTALAELQRSYDMLLQEAASAIGRVFGSTLPVSNLRQTLRERAIKVASMVGDPGVRAIVGRMMEGEADDTAWLESVVGLIAQRPPASWRDGDQERFQVSLAKVSRLFLHAESLAFAIAGAQVRPDEEAFRIGLTSTDSPEIERVVRIPAADRRAVADLERALLGVLNPTHLNGSRDLALGAVARLTRRLLSNDTDNRPKSEGAAGKS
jgi:hypothetical protein